MSIKEASAAKGALVGAAFGGMFGGLYATRNKSFSPDSYAMRRTKIMTGIASGAMGGALLGGVMGQKLKVAVSLNQLRRATSGARNSRLVRRGISMENAKPFVRDSESKRLTAVGIAGHSRKHLPKGMKNMAGKAYVEGDSSQRVGASLQEGGRHATESAKGLKGVFSKGSVREMGEQGSRASRVGKRIKGLKGKDRETFNRTVILHEKAEAGVKAKATNAQAGHNSLKPPLQDLNIAATLKDQPGAAKAIRGLREGEIKSLKKKHPTSFGRLNLGKERLSRHAIKRLNEASKRKG